MAKIIIDIDGVIRNTNKAIVKLCKEKLDKIITEDDINDWDLMKCIGINPEWIFTEYGKEIFEHAEIYRESISALKSIVNVHNLVLVSNQINADNIWFTDKWLYRYDIFLPVVYVEDKNEVEADIIIDDYPKNLRNHTAKHKFLFDQPHNRDCNEFERVFNMYHFINKIKELKIK